MLQNGDRTSWDEAALQEQRHTLEVLSQIGPVLSTESDVSRLTQAVIDAAAEMTDAYFGALFYQASPDSDTRLQVAASRVSLDALAYFSAPFSTEVLRPVVRDRKTLRVDNAQQDQSDNPPYLDTSVGRVPINSYLTVPLISRSGQILGILLLGHTERGAFADSAERMVQGLAVQVALAIDNLQLSQQFKQTRLQDGTGERHYRSLAESIPQIVWTARPDGWIDYFNQHWINYTGLAFEQTQGWGWKQALHPDDARVSVDKWEHAVKTGEDYEIEYRIRRASDGSYRWHLGRAVPIRDHNGQIIEWFGTCTDIHDQKRAEETLQFLAGATTILGASLDYETTLKNVANLIVPRLADWCTIDLAGPGGTSSQLALAHIDAAKVKQARELQRRFPPLPDTSRGLPRVLRTGQSELVSEITDELLASAARDAEHLEILRNARLKSYMIVPLIARGRVLGAMTLITAESGRRYGPDDLAQVEHLARRAAAAVDNALLYRAAQQEIAERKRIEEELRQSKEQLEIIFRSVTDGITLQEPSGHLIYANEIAARLVGYPSVQALLNAPPEEITDKFEIMDEEGRPFPVSQLPGRLALQGYMGAEATLHFRVRETGEERWSIVKATPVFDANGQVRFAINITRDITERRQAEQEIRTLNAELEQRVIERTAQLKATNKMLEAEVMERKRAEVALREANDKLETRVKERTADLKAANEELSTFTYIVSHDLRSPLVNLKGFASELRSAVDVISKGIDAAVPYLDADQAAAVTRAIQQDIPEALEYIDSAVNRMDHLTSAVLKLSRLGRRELNIESIDMNALVQNILNSLAHQIKERQVKVTVSPLPSVRADRLSMEQVMGNLLTNAVLYLSPDRPGEIEVTGERVGDEVTYHVRDNGRGIAEDDRHKVFEPFRRAGKASAPGEGMGLAYAQAMVRRHGGRIWYNSELGVGTTFSFTAVNNFVKGTDDDRH